MAHEDRDLLNMAWESLAESEISHLILKHVFNWPEPKYELIKFFTPSANASDDFTVFKFIRENWDFKRKTRFTCELNQLRADRCMKIPADWPFEFYAKIGDYSHAALLVIKSEKGV